MDERFLGAWRQILPPTAPDEVVVRFERDGLLVWAVEGETALSLELNWSVRDDVLVIERDQAPAQLSHFRFEPGPRLILDRAGVVYEYTRAD